MSKVLLFDLDGVLTLPEEVFSVLYARSHGYDLAPFAAFFQNEWGAFVTGKADLRQHIRDNPNLWRWEGTPDELLKYWFDSENVKNEPLLNAIKDARAIGVPCYIVTEQEKYRTNYIRTEMFSEDFDGVFSTAEIGFKKNDVRFYQAVMNSLDIDPADVIFFDDSQSKLDAAKSIGIQAYLYTDPGQITSILAKIQASNS